MTLYLSRGKTKRRIRVFMRKRKKIHFISLISSTISKIWMMKENLFLYHQTNHISKKKIEKLIFKHPIVWKKKQDWIGINRPLFQLSLTNYLCCKWPSQFYELCNRFLVYHSTQTPISFPWLSYIIHTTLVHHWCNSYISLK